MPVTANMSALPKGSLVLITGVNGFIASHIADQLLEHGYAVRGTVRSADKGTWIKEAMTHRHPSARFETVVVANMATPGAFNDCMTAVSAVVHTASNLSFSDDPNAVIPECLAGMQQILEAAAAHKSVTRFVYTSSSAAALLPTAGTRYEITPATWNDAAVATAWAPPPYTNRAINVYAASKTQTERAAWAFVAEHKPGFVLNAILPNYNIGPILHANQPASSAGVVRAFARNPADPATAAMLKGFGPYWVVDVVDVALLHVAALTEEDVREERVLGFAHFADWNAWLGVFRKLAPEKAWPADDAQQDRNLGGVRNERGEELLKRFGRQGWTSLEESTRGNLQDPPEY